MQYWMTPIIIFFLTIWLCSFSFKMAIFQVSIQVSFVIIKILYHSYCTSRTDLLSSDTIQLARMNISARSILPVESLRTLVSFIDEMSEHQIVLTWKMLEQMYCSVACVWSKWRGSRVWGGSSTGLQKRQKNDADGEMVTVNGLWVGCAHSNRHWQASFTEKTHCLQCFHIGVKRTKVF